MFIQVLSDLPRIDGFLIGFPKVISYVVPENFMGLTRPCSCSSRFGVHFVCNSLRRMRRETFLPAIPSAPVALPPSFSGSILLLFSPSYKTVCRLHHCPISFVFRSFGRWVLRSACVGVLCLAGRRGLFAGLDPELRFRFISLAVPALGLPSSLAVPGVGSRRALWRNLSEVWTDNEIPPLPDLSLPFEPDKGALTEGFKLLCGSLGWSLSRGRLCPPAVRGILACLCGWVLRSL